MALRLEREAAASATAMSDSAAASRLLLDPLLVGTSPGVPWAVIR